MCTVETLVTLWHACTSAIWGALFQSAAYPCWERKIMSWNFSTSSFIILSTEDSYHLKGTICCNHWFFKTKCPVLVILFYFFQMLDQKNTVFVGEITDIAERQKTENWAHLRGKICQKKKKINRTLWKYTEHFVSAERRVGGMLCCKAAPCSFRKVIWNFPWVT